MRRLIFLVVVTVTACGGGTDSPTGPGPVPQPNSPINYTVIGASDAIGYGASVFCLPFFECPDGRGYVHVVTRDLRARGFTVNLTNLGLPSAVLSPRLQDLGTRHGRLIPGNFLEAQLPWVAASATLVTVFAGANDVDTIIAALGGGAGGSDQTAYVNDQIRLFRGEYDTLIRSIRERAPSARVIVLNLPNMAGMPRLASAPLLHRRAAEMLSTGISTTVINPYATQGVFVIDLLCDRRSYEASTYSSDGFHPGDTGYAWMAAEVIAAATTSYRLPVTSCSHTTIVR